jgi:plasmid stabilization system protein ParE
MAWEVIFSARSRNDLEQIVKFIARDDPAAAERFSSKLIDRAESLADAPEMRTAIPAKTRHKILSSRFISDHLPTRRETTPRGDPAILGCGTQRTSDAVNCFACAILVNLYSWIRLAHNDV